MHRISRRLVVIAVVVAVVVGTGGAALAASGRLNFAFKSIREGVPNGIGRFTLTSTDLRQNQPIPQQFWGCSGPGVSPELSWSGAPAATQSYALTMYDPDAPTGSGFWHWIAWDIPTGTTSLPTGVNFAPGVNGRNDGGGFGYTGPCPPVGDIKHRYQFTILALDVPSLQLPADTPPAAVGFTMRVHIIAAASFTAAAPPDLSRVRSAAAHDPAVELGHRRPGRHERTVLPGHRVAEPVAREVHPPGRLQQQLVPRRRGGDTMGLLEGPGSMPIDPSRPSITVNWQGRYRAVEEPAALVLDARLVESPSGMR